MKNKHDTFIAPPDFKMISSGAVGFLQKKREFLIKTKCLSKIELQEYFRNQIYLWKKVSAFPIKA